MVTTALGIAAATWAVVMAVSPLLQVREILRRGSSEGISASYFAVLVGGFCLWIAYGVARHDVPLVVPNSAAVAVTLFTIAVILRKR
jgi:MtN3 and saliva related transmembrane protein